MMPPTITPFWSRVPDSELADLRRRIAAHRWPATETSPDQGVSSRRMGALAERWLDFDWRAVETWLDAAGQARTAIDGLDIHFLHLRSPRPEATPVLLTHGWPGSVLEFRHVIERVSDPRAGLPPMHLVIPSLPGYGFSDAPAEAGWDIHRIARAWHELMGRLGYRDYVAGGSDWGTSVSTSLGLQFADAVRALYLVPPLAAPITDKTPTAEEAETRAALRERQRTGSAYSEVHATRPQTIGHALNDSPIGLLAWLAEKFDEWADPRTPVAADDLLADVSLYWFTRSAPTSIRLYYESIRQVSAWFTAPAADQVRVPTGCAVFPAELPRPSRREAERRFTRIVHWGEPEFGGHFAALEQPGTYLAHLAATIEATAAG